MNALNNKKEEELIYTIVSWIILKERGYPFPFNTKS